MEWCSKSKKWQPFPILGFGNPWDTLSLSGAACSCVSILSYTFLFALFWWEFRVIWLSNFTKFAKVRKRENNFCNRWSFTKESIYFYNILLLINKYIKYMFKNMSIYIKPIYTANYYLNKLLQYIFLFPHNIFWSRDHVQILEIESKFEKMQNFCSIFEFYYC